MQKQKEKWVGEEYGQAEKENERKRKEAAGED